MKHPDILKIVGDYGIKKPIYISTVIALKWVRGQMLFEELNPGMYHRSTARSWLWKNRASKYIEDAKLACPTVHMNNNICTYRQLHYELQNSVERWINQQSHERFSRRHNAGIEEMPVCITASDSIPSVSLALDRLDLRNYTKASILDLQHKLNEVCRQHKLVEKHKNIPRDVYGHRNRISASHRLFNKWYGDKNGNRISRFG